MQAVIMAGGKGTRISSVNNTVPKPMIQLFGKPILEMEIENIKKYGITDIVLTIGYKGNVIKEYFGDGSGISPVTKKPFGVNIKYYEEKEPLGSAGALYQMMDMLEDTFLLINGDIVFNFDFNTFINFHSSKNVIASIVAHPNDHPYDSGNIGCENGIVTSWLTPNDKKPVYYKNLSNAGIHIMTKEALILAEEMDMIRNKKESGIIAFNLDKDILIPLSKYGKVGCYITSEYIKDMGTPERLEEVSSDYEHGYISVPFGKRKAVFIDRDGTINKHIGFLKSAEEFELLTDASDAIRNFNKNGWLSIVVTNQPVIARGEATWNDLKEIHMKMETELGKSGAYLNDIFVCPHHPDKGFAGEIQELKYKCNCRKPSPGLIFKAAEQYGILLSESWTIGDSESDILAGKRAGTKTALIGTEDYGQDMTVSSLFEFSLKII